MQLLLFLLMFQGCFLPTIPRAQIAEVQDALLDIRRNNHSENLTLYCKYTMYFTLYWSLWPISQIFVTVVPLTSFLFV